MNITGRFWRELTREERMICLQFAAEENRKKWEKAASAKATIN